VAGHRLTHIERVADHAALMERLAALVSEFFAPAAAVHTGSATMVAGLDARAAGDGRATAA
jgi:hypothetical protein